MTTIEEGGQPGEGMRWNSLYKKSGGRGDAREKCRGTQLSTSR